MEIRFWNFTLKFKWMIQMNHNIPWLSNSDSKASFFANLWTHLIKVRCVKCRPCCFPDPEHDVRAGVRAAAPEWGTGQEDCSSGKEAGLHPPQRPITARCSFSGHNKTTKGLSGRVGLPHPLPLILFELWVLFSPCQAALSRIQCNTELTQLLVLQNLH